MTNHRETTQQNYGCEDIIGLIGAYSIGATSPEETRTVEALLPECPEAMMELADYIAVSDAMLHALPMDKQPPQNLLGALNLNDTAPTFAAPTELHHSANGNAEQPQLTALPPAQPQPNRTTLWVSLAGIAAAVILIFGMNAVWFMLYRGLQQQQTQLTSLIEQQQELITNFESVPAAAPLMVTGPTHAISLQPMEGMSANAQIVYDSRSHIGTVYANGLPQPSTGHGYQMWLVRGDEVTSLGTFSVTESGEGSLVFQSPLEIMPTDVIGISTEPVNGSLEPTTPHLVTGKIDT